MQQIEILTRLEDGKGVIDLLQQKGTVELRKTEPEKGLTFFETSQSVAQLDRALSVANTALELVNRYVPEKKKLTELFSARRELPLSQYMEMADNADDYLRVCYEISDTEKQIADLHATAIRLGTQADMLNAWLDLDIPAETEETAQTAVLIGAFQANKSRAEILGILASAKPEIETVEAEIVSATERQTCAVVLCMKEQENAVHDALRAAGFVRLSDVPAGLPRERKAKLLAAKAESEKQIELLKTKMQSYADKRSEIRFVADYYAAKKEKYEALQYVAAGRRILFISGFIPEVSAEETVREIESRFTAAVSVGEPDAPEEEIPVLLKNNAFVSPVEGITEMYSHPSNHDIDPNAIMSFFYYFFFGMMLSDAGYGILIVIATAIALWKFKLEESMRKTVRMYFFCGISTTVWGLLYGSFFGDFIPTLFTQFLGKPAPRMYLWLDPMASMMELLVWCFAFGLIHLFTGVAIKAYLLIKEKKYFDAFCETVPVYVTVLGVAPTAAGIIIDTVPAPLKTYGLYAAAVGVVLIVLTAGRSSESFFGKLGGGLYGLYNVITGYLGDVLSYSRLLALGLATGVIGQVINLMGTIPQNMVLKTILFIVVSLIGHTANLAINLIGAYVHTDRLQYVEFFSRFYDGGGKNFAPLKMHTKFYTFKEEQ